MKRENKTNKKTQFDLIKLKPMQRLEIYIKRKKT